MHAYNEMYAADAQDNLAALLDWACNQMGIPLETVFSLFACSSLGERFSIGDPSIVAGKSGAEIGYELLVPQGLMPSDYPLSQVKLDFFHRSPEYWTGWVLAYFQWSEGLSFAQIHSLLDINDVRKLYWPYHEMDVKQACDAIVRLVFANHQETNLKRMRIRAGLSQSDLAGLTGISVRTIQHYEQRQKCINKASVETVLQICKYLRCAPQDIIEPIAKERYDYAVVALPKENSGIE